MAFGIDRKELKRWKRDVKEGRVAIITHFWYDKRFPESSSVTKVGCKDLEKLISWGKQYNLQPEWIHRDEQYPHFDLFGEKQKEVLENENKIDQIKRFISKEKNTSQS